MIRALIRGFKKKYKSFIFLITIENGIQKERRGEERRGEIYFLFLTFQFSWLECYSIYPFL
jgi:hypothetical protein